MENSIPKIIHYCWFGNNEKPDDIKLYIEGWKENNPEYKIIEWNESNFDLELFPYAKQAYESGKYAFVTDVVRLYALFNYGGIYMDTDVEVLKPFDDLLHHKAFTGCENDKMCVTGTIGSRIKNKWVEKLLSYYDDKNFIHDDGKLDLTTNTNSITRITTNEFGWVPMDSKQDLDDVYIYSSDYFCAKSFYTGKINVTENTYTIHHFKGSWKTGSDKLRSKILNLVKKFLINLFGDETFNKVNKKIRKGD